MTVKLNELATVMLFALVGVVLWLLRHNTSVMVVPSWATEDVNEEEDLPTWGDLT